MRGLYPLGNTGAEHDRLARQAGVLSKFTERFFREAGVGSGQRVLDLGSGAGDVSMLLSRIVGATGSVTGVEWNSESVARARERAAHAGLTNVEFIASDVSEIPVESPFDAAVGRLILEFLPNPVAVLRSTAQRVKPGGVLAFLEPSWRPMLRFAEGLPLVFQSAMIAYETLKRCDADVEFGIKLSRAFQAAGLPPPKIRIHTPIVEPLETGRWLRDLLVSLNDRMSRCGISPDALGNFDTLADRIAAEIENAKAVVPLMSLVGAWCTMP